MFGKKPYFLLTALLFFLTISVYLKAINPDKFGFYHDDGIYLVTAKALATGQGYRILSLPDRPHQTKYPPLYPLALSALWRADPHFPGNLTLFFAFTILCMLVFHALASAYLVKRSYANWIQVFLIFLLTAFNWRVVILAASILSEALFAALALCVLWVASSQGEKPFTAKGLFLGILLGLVALTRLPGISLLAAVPLYALTRKQIRRFLLPIALASSIIGGWFLWCHLHQASSTGSNLAYYTNYLQDWRSLIQVSESGVQTSLLGSVASMVGKNVVTMLSTIPVLCFGIEINKIQTMPAAWQFSAILIGLCSLVLLVVGFYKTRNIENGLLHYFVLAYLAMHLLWPYPIYDRFLIPILPFLLLFIVSGGTHILRGRPGGLQMHTPWTTAARLAFPCAILASLLAAACLGLTYGILDQIMNAKIPYVTEAQEKREMTAWLKTNGHGEDILVSYQDPIYFLYTGIKAIRLPAPENTESVMSYGDRLKGFVEKNKATLLLQTENDFSLQGYPVQDRKVLAETLLYRPLVYVPVFSTPSRKSTLYRIAVSSDPE